MVAIWSNFYWLRFTDIFLIRVSSIVRHRICNQQDVIIIIFKYVFMNIFCDIKHNGVYSLSKGLNSLFRLWIHFTQVGICVWFDFSTENYHIYSSLFNEVNFRIFRIFKNIYIIFITFQLIWFISIIHHILLPMYFG